MDPIQESPVTPPAPEQQTNIEPQADYFSEQQVAAATPVVPVEAEPSIDAGVIMPPAPDVEPPTSVDTPVAPSVVPDAPVSEADPSTQTPI